MARGDDGEATLSPDEAFALLGNEYRAEIVRALGDAQGSRGPRPTLSFSDLYDRADVDVATSQFNYHLSRLVGHFVDKTPEGYRLRHEAVAIYRTILAGTYTRETAIEPFPVGLDCYDCDAPVEASYADRRFVVACSDCGREYSNTTAPPTIADADREALLARVDQYLRHRILAFSKGVCSVCAGGLATEFLPTDDLDVAGADQLDLYVHRSCAHCGAQQYMSVGLTLLYDADLVAFFAQQGRDVTTTPIWELEFAMTDRATEVRSTDPWTVALRLEHDSATLELMLDGELAVVERSRSP